MSFSTLVRNKNSERLIALLSAVAVLMSLMAIYAPVAKAHHPELVANQTCVDREVVVQYTSTSWLTTGASGSGHSDIRIQARPEGGSWVEVGSGAYTGANGYRFTGTFDGADLSGQQYWGATIEVRAFASGPWDNGSAGGQYSSVAKVKVTQDCFNPSCPSGFLQHKVEPVSSGTFGPNGEFTITVGSTANGQVFSWTSTLPVFQVIAKGGPGANVYDYSGAFSGSGLHSPVNPNNGSYYGLSHITFCYQEIQDEPVEVSVEPGVCELVNGLPGATVEVEIDPDSGATVTFTNGSTTVDVTASGTVFLAPGTWSWSATANDGFELTGATTGQVTIDDCEVSVGVNAGVCTVNGAGAAVGSVEIEIDPASGAVVTVYSDPARTQELFDTGTTGSFDLAPGTYYWEADSAAGFDIDGPTSGQFTIAPCEVTVSVDGECVVDGTVGVGDIAVTISVDGGATVVITDQGGATVATLTESGTVTVPEGAIYSWSASSAAGFAVVGGSSGEVDVEECSPPPDEVGAAISVIVVGTCEVTDGLGHGEIDVTIAVDGGATVTITDSDGGVVDTLTASGSLSVPEGETYSWSAVPSEGFEFPSGSDTSGTIVIETCTPDEVLASIQVTVSGSCELDGDEGEGLVDITMSVPDGATVVVRDSDGDVVGTLTDDGTLSVPEGATYTWVATPSEGFEFPPGFDSSGTFAIERCSDPETLPFTGFDPYQMGVFAILLMGAGVTAVFLAPKEEGA